MTNFTEHATSLSPRELDKILSDAWETAARLNPMFLVRLSPDFAFQHLRGVINDCLIKGMPPKEISAFVVQELLGQPASTTSCRSAPGGQHDEKVSS